MIDTDALLSLCGPGLLTMMTVDISAEAKVIGNAFVISARNRQAIIMTATHNVHYMDRLASKLTAFESLITARQCNPNARSSVRMIAGIRFACVPGASANIDFFTMNEHHDVCTAIAENASDSAPPFESQFALKLFPPKPGEYVYVLGATDFVCMPGSTDYEADTTEGKISCRSTAVPAKVIQAYDHKPGVTRGPCFEVEANFPPGLSGAPVIWFDDAAAKPYVCGLVSSDQAVDGIATVSMIYPALSLTVSEGPPEAAERRTLHNLASRGIIECYPGELERFVPPALS